MAIDKKRMEDTAEGNYKELRSQVMSGGQMSFDAWGNEEEAGQIGPMLRSFIVEADAGRMPQCFDDLCRLMDEHYEVFPCVRNQWLAVRAAIRMGWLPGRENIKVVNRAR